MPRKLVEPEAGRAPDYTLRGAYLGVGVERSAGTPDKRLAAARAPGALPSAIAVEDLNASNDE